MFMSHSFTWASMCDDGWGKEPSKGGSINSWSDDSICDSRIAGPPGSIHCWGWETPPMGKKRRVDMGYKNEWSNANILQKENFSFPKKNMETSKAIENPQCRGLQPEKVSAEWCYRVEEGKWISEVLEKKKKKNYARSISERKLSPPPKRSEGVRPGKSKRRDTTETARSEMTMTKRAAYHAVWPSI